MSDLLLPMRDGLMVANRASYTDDVDDLTDEARDRFPTTFPLRPRVDRGFIVGRYVGANFYNTNGHYFVLDELERDRHTIPHVPLDVSHQSTFIVGHYLAQDLIYPPGWDAPSDAAPEFHNPYVRTQMVVYKRIHPKVWKATKDAFDAGMVFQSMQCSPQSLTCSTAGCPCTGKRYKYDGIRSDTYCDALNQPRSRKKLHDNLFTAGALVIPPARPGWNRADLTMVAGLIEANAEQAEQLYYQLAAELDHLEPADWEWMMSALLAAAADDEIPPRPVRVPGADLPKDLTTRGENIPTVVAAGLAVRADDTGRVLMLQRSLAEENDPARGTWEVPGGRLEEDESPLDAAKREWCEEVGCDLPSGELGATWQTKVPGSYVGHVWHVAREADVPINLPSEHRTVADPDGDRVETVAWFTPDQAVQLGKNLREEMRHSIHLWHGPMSQPREMTAVLIKVRERAVSAALANQSPYVTALEVAAMVDEIMGPPAP